MRENTIPRAVGTAAAALILSLGMGTSQGALAQESPGATATATPSAAEAYKAAPRETAAPGVPKLHIVWDCGECEHNEKVPPLIEQAYAAEAAKEAHAVSDTDVAEVAIVDLRQRSPGARVMLGIMAGKDRLGLRIRYRGQEYAVADSSANALMGLNYLSESVGKRTYEKLAPVAAGR